MPQSRNFSTFRFLEKLRAGLGAAGLVAVLGETLLSSGLVARVFGGSLLPFGERLGGLSLIALSLIAFFVFSLLSDVTDDEIDRRSRARRERDSGA